VWANLIQTAANMSNSSVPPQSLDDLPPEMLAGSPILKGPILRIRNSAETFTDNFFVELRSTKERTCQPPTPEFGNKCKQLRECACVMHLLQFNSVGTILHFLQFYNFQA
jgi:hypothetical protein